MSLVWILQLGTTLFLTGLIWFVQIVHYPLFARVGAEGFSAFHREHSRLTAAVAAPIMLLELGSALWLVAAPAGDLLGTVARGTGTLWVSLALLLAIWVSTFFLQVPAHGVLSRGFDTQAHQTLVRTNWIRTVLWTVRSALLVWLTLRARG